MSTRSRSKSRRRSPRKKPSPKKKPSPQPQPKNQDDEVDSVEESSDQKPGLIDYLMAGREIVSAFHLFLVGIFLLIVIMNPVLGNLPLLPFETVKWEDRQYFETPIVVRSKSSRILKFYQFWILLFS